MKLSLVVLTACLLTANVGDATESRLEHPTQLRLRSVQPGAQIWIEEGVFAKINSDKNGLMLKGYDVVAYFSANKAVKGSVKYESFYQGAKYHFSSATNKAFFKRNPERYVPQNGDSVSMVFWKES